MGFLCHLCGKEFSTKQNYTRHWTSLHENEDIDEPNAGNKRIVCNFCGKRYKRRENLQKHIVSVHKPEEKEHYMKQCEVCNKKVDRGSYKRHMVLKHRPIIGEVKDRPKFNCSICNARFNTGSSLNYHKKKIHKIKTTKTALTIKCPLCNYITKAPSRHLMQIHFAENHNINIEYKSCHFKSIDKFFTWKSEIEKQTTSKFIRAKAKSDVIMFKCHRSGKYNSMTIKRNLKMAGSCKINGFCPAFIKAKIVDRNDVNVTYQLTHVGHTNELRHISLTSEERKAIAVQLAKNVPYDEILKKIKGSLSDSPLQRIHLTNRKDIHNIKKSFDLNAIAVEHPFDLKGKGDENIFNLRTESVESVKTEQNVDDNLEPVDFNTIKVEHSVDLQEEENIVNVASENVEYPKEQILEVQPEVDENEEPDIKTFDYNSIVVENTFNLNSEVENTYEIIEEAIEQPVQFISGEIVNTPQNAEVVYDFNGETVTYSFNVNVDEVDYQNNCTEVTEYTVDDTEEAVENLLKLNSAELKQFLDPEGLNKWVSNLKASSNTSLAVYKPQGVFDPEFPGLDHKDFMLIYMSEAQKDILIKDSKDIVSIEVTQCHELQLYALLIPDETRDGFPVAFMFTNRGDEFDLYIFFEKIKQVVGFVPPISFMTNIEENIYSTWAKVMGQNILHLYCSRHVLQAWKTDVNGKIKVKDKRNQVYKSLQSLLYELDEGNFHSALEENMLKWSQDDGTLGFYDYFSKLYGSGDQFKKWAYCFRVNAGINTSISIDSFNRILKQSNLRGDKLKQSDKTLCDVLNLLRVKVFELVIRINKGKVAKKLQNLRLRHGYSYANDSEYVIQEVDKWQVLNYVGNEVSEVYTVKKLKDCKKCLLQCQHCNSCFHEYVCSCSDHLLKNNMCKHIHLVARTQKLMETNQSGIDADMDVSAPCEADSTTENIKLNEIGVVQISDAELPFAVRKRQFIDEVKKCLEEHIQTIEDLEYVKQQCKPILSNTTKIR